MDILDYLEFNVATNQELQKITGLNAKAVSRQLHKLGGRIVKIPNGRSPKYALTKNAFGVNDEIHLWETDTYGKTYHIATIRPLSAGGFFIELMPNMSKLLLGEAKNGYYEDLPYFLRDMAPQGFLGRKIAKEIHSRDERFPNDPKQWNAKHIGRYLLSNNEDVIGNLRFGVNTNLRLRSNFSRSTSADYPELARQTLSSDINFSSAAGEQAKFITYCTEQNAHVLVKFSPKGDDATARRWRDILITEYWATQTLKNTNIAVATTRLLEADERLFLESIRFDRRGEHGRESMLSLLMIDAEFVGNGANWVPAILELHQQNLVAYQDLLNTQQLHLFGRLINNTDMHLGNLSLGIKGDLFNLLPVYDMCSMGFAPRAGEVLPFEFEYPPQNNTALNSASIKYITKLANQFWHSVYQDSRISPEFKDFLTEFLPTIAGQKQLI